MRLVQACPTDSRGRSGGHGGQRPVDAHVRDSDRLCHRLIGHLGGGDVDPELEPRIAGCGADAAPYFRIFNPIMQGEKFDPQGQYVRRWVPELQRLPDRWIHAPWTAPASVLKTAGVELGVNYPQPIVDHKQARERALQAFGTIGRGR